MDAYSSYIMQISEARCRDLRREADEYRLSRAARGTRIPWLTRAFNGLERRRAAVVEPRRPVSLPLPTADESRLRRTA